ncbi:MAG: trigger factor [Patescibacteria group bacterium]
MKHSFKKLPGSMMELEVDLTQEEFDKYYQPIYEEALSEVELKGFRKGAAPRELSARAVNKAKVFEDATTDAVRFSLNELVQDNKWILVDKPVVEITSGTDGLKYQAKITLFPEVKVADYKKIAKKNIDVRHPIIEKMEVGDEEIEKSLYWLKKSRIKDGVEPNLDDEFAKSVGKFESLSDLKSKIRSGLLEEKKWQEKEKTRIKMLEEIAEKSKIDIPQIMVDKTKENYKCAEEEARKRVTNHIIINEIAQKENLRPDEKEIEAEVAKYQHQADQLDKSRFYDYIYGILQNKKVFEFLEKC